MPQPVTTSELLLQEVAGLLTEIRDLLRERPAEKTQEPERAPAKKSPVPATGRRTRASK